MQKSLLLIFALLSFTKVIGQRDTIRPIQLMVEDSATKKKITLSITELRCEVKVTGNRVQTDYHITFYNPNNRDMEGTLEFPLGDNENVVRFALDVNGVLREGVVVDKAKGREVFENIERRRVDPGLMEKTLGNSYRARVYPVPANGTKRLVIGCERIIRPKKGEDMLVSVPLSFAQKIKKFDLRVDVYNETEVPQPEKNELVNITFEKWNNVFTASKSIDNFDANTVLKFMVPRKGGNEQILATKNTDGKYVFSATVFPEFNAQMKAITKNIGIVWDASFSGSYRDTKKELVFLQEYLKNHTGNVKVQVVQFNDSKEKSFTLKKGNWEELITFLKAITYDGATNLSLFNLEPKNCDEVILFSDGMSTFGKTELKPGKIPVLAYVSQPASDYSALKYLAQTTGGKFIDGNVLTSNDALKVANEKPYHFIGLKNANGIEDFYGDLSIVSGTAFTFSGISTKLPIALELQFGIGDSVLVTQKINISESQLTESGSGTARIWALQKLQSLEMQPFRNKQVIVDHSTEWKVVSAFTSLIVLETLEDYIQYEIIPPDDMRKEYFAHVENTKKAEEQSKKERLDYVYNLYNEKIGWYEIRYDDTIRLVQQEIIIKNKIKDLERQLDTLHRSQNHYQRIVDSLGQEIVRTNEELEYTHWQLDSLHSPESHMRPFKDMVLLEDVTINESMHSREEMSKMMSESLRSEISNAMASGSMANVLVEDPLNPEASYERNRNEEISIQEWDPESPYMTKLKSVKDEELYKTYLDLRGDYLYSASFYLDVADYFQKKKMRKEAVLLLSNLAELKNEDAPFIRILATRYMQMGENEYALLMYERARELRTEEPQSYRDLALILERCGKFQQAVDTFYRIVEKSWDGRFPAIENIVLTEMNKVIATCGKKLDVSKFDERLLVQMPSDVRIVLNWDSDGVDIDLHVIDPIMEECYYGHQRTRIGGRMSNDYTGGYGPEEFMAHYGMDGIYKMKIKFYGERSVTLLGPTTIMIQVFTNYGKKDQKVQEFTRRLETTGEWLEVGEITFTSK